MKRYFLSEAMPYEDYTGNTVIRHMETFLKAQGYQSLNYKWKDKEQGYYSFLRLIQVFFWSFTISNGSIVLFHFPVIPRASQLLLRLLNRKKVVTVALVHDFNGLRFKQDEVYESEKKSINSFAHIIVHNNNMKQLVSTFYQNGQISTLWLFDYDAPAAPFLKRVYSFECTIAANLQKANYLKDNVADFISENDPLKLHVYGNVPEDLHDRFSNRNLKLHGPVHPDTLPGCIAGSFGIVWDGDSLTTCSGSLGEYLKFNTPHKLSLYLAAGLPVIVWSGSAMAEWVIKNKVGITIQSWSELKSKLASMNEEAYTMLQLHAQQTGMLLRKGSFINHVMRSIEKEYLDS